MKKVIVLAVLIAMVLSITAAFAGVSKTEIIIRRDVEVKTYIESVNRYVMGYARQNMAPNFWKNDWDTWYVGEKKFGNLTAEEIAYLKTVNTTGSEYVGRWVFVDLANQTVVLGPFSAFSTNYVSPFSNSSTQEVTGTDVLVNVQDLDPLTVLITITTTTYITVENVTYQLVTQVYDSSPIVLDLNNDGKIDVARNDWKPHAPKFYKDYAKFFDITGNGSKDFTEWMAPNAGDGLLVMPENGKVETALHLFGIAGGYRDGYEKLALLFDKDGNGYVEGPELEGLAIWIDENNDAICQEHEIKSLSDFNIARISTKHTDFVSYYTTTDGRTHKSWDWWPAVYETRMFRN